MPARLATTCFQALCRSSAGLLLPQRHSGGRPVAKEAPPTVATGAPAGSAGALIRICAGRPATVGDSNMPLTWLIWAPRPWASRGGRAAFALEQAAGDNWRLERKRHPQRADRRS